MFCTVCLCAVQEIKPATGYKLFSKMPVEFFKRIIIFAVLRLKLMSVKYTKIKNKKKLVLIW